MSEPFNPDEWEPWGRWGDYMKNKETGKYLHIHNYNKKLEEYNE